MNTQNTTEPEAAFAPIPATVAAKHVPLDPTRQKRVGTVIVVAVAALAVAPVSLLALAAAVVR